MTTIRRFLGGAVFSAAVMATAVTSFYCSSSTSSPSGSTGTMKVYMTDAPADYDAVWINVIRVECHRDITDSTSGWVVLRNDSGVFNLLTLRNGARVLLGSADLDAGHYTQIRLILGSGSSVVVNGTSYPLTIPSGMQSGIKLNFDFDIVAGKTYELLMDYNADASIHQTGNGKYMMNPVIRLVAVDASGSITGVVAPATARATAWTVIGEDTVRSVCDTLTGAFTLSGMIAGTYAVHLNPSNTFFRDSAVTNVSVAAAQTTNIGTVILLPR